MKQLITATMLTNNEDTLSSFKAPINKFTFVFPFQVSPNVGDHQVTGIWGGERIVFTNVQYGCTLIGMAYAPIRRC